MKIINIFQPAPFYDRNYHKWKCWQLWTAPKIITNFSSYIASYSNVSYDYFVFLPLTVSKPWFTYIATLSWPVKENV